MTECLITAFSIVVFLSNGSYNPSIPFLTFFFLFWTYYRLKGSEPSWAEHYRGWFGKLYPFAGALFFGIKPDLTHIEESLKPLLQICRVIPLLAVSQARLTLFRLSEKSKERTAAVLFLLFYLMALRTVPHPFIDVFTSNTAAADFFKNGLNPYLQSYPDIYGGSYDYQPGFLYWPTALYLQTLSRFLFNDIRTILALAWWVSPFLFSRSKSFPKTFHVALFWWSVPFIAFALVQSWLDPLLSMFAALSIYAIQKKRPILLALAIGSAASIKQYGAILGIFAIPYHYLTERNFRHTFFLALGSLLLFLLSLAPFLIQSSDSFLSMTVLNHIHAHARKDALNFTAFFMRNAHLEFTGILQSGFILIGFILAGFHLYWNCSRKGLRTLPEAWAISFGFSIIFGKFAFCNYYLLLISFWLLSILPLNSDLNQRHQG